MGTRFARFYPLFSSNAEDSLVFIGPLFLALLTASSFLFLVRYISQEQLRYWYYSVYAFFFLIPHVYSTVYKFRTDQEIRKDAYFTEKRVLVSIFLCSVGMFFCYPFIFMIVLTYIDIFHNVRQQYGWVVLSQKKQPTITKHERTLDKLMIYNVMIGPLIWWHAHPTKYGWMQHNDIQFFLPRLGWRSRACCSLDYFCLLPFLLFLLLSIE